jgi:hypothetical protein
VIIKEKVKLVALAKNLASIYQYMKEFPLPHCHTDMHEWDPPWTKIVYPIDARALMKYHYH